jgi:hypothetical protein
MSGDSGRWFRQTMQGLPVFVQKYANDEKFSFFSADTASISRYFTKFTQKIPAMAV